MRRVKGLQLLDELRTIVGPAHVLTGTELANRPTHLWDATPLAARALVRPLNTEETGCVLAACHKAGCAVVTHGGITGLAEGERSTESDIVLSLERQRLIEAIDPVGRNITVQAGCVLESVQSAAIEAGLQLGIDLGARGSCTIGGNIATNAGGLSVLRYGMMRAQVLGLEVVLADGRILSSMNHMLKNNAGYDLKQLFIGSEGTLGVITRAVLRLYAPTPHVQTALVAFEGYAQVTGLLSHVDRELGGSLHAFEVLWNAFYALNTDLHHASAVRPPLESHYPIYAIVESRSAQADAAAAAFNQALEGALTMNLISDAVIAQSDTECRSIWSLRENFETLNQHQPQYNYDISLPVGDMDRYLGKIHSELQSIWPSLCFFAYGHLADGNLHVTVAPGALGDRLDEAPDWQSISDRIVYTPLQALGGSVSAEHGIGLTKKVWLGLSRNAEEIAIMRELKRTLDPTGLLNPGKIF